MIDESSFRPMGKILLKGIASNHAMNNRNNLIFQMKMLGVINYKNVNDEVYCSFY